MELYLKKLLFDTKEMHVEASYTEEKLGYLFDNKKRVFEFEPHPDLWQKLQKFEPIFKTIVFEHSDNKVYIVGIEFKSIKDVPYCVLFAEKHLDRGRILEYKTPAFPVEDKDLPDNFKVLCEDIRDEFEDLHNGKNGNNQLDLFDEFSKQMKDNGVIMGSLKEKDVSVTIEMSKETFTTSSTEDVLDKHVKPMYPTTPAPLTIGPNGAKTRDFN